MSSSTLKQELLGTNAEREEVRGFLTQVWTAQTSLPFHSPTERFTYFIQRGVETLLALPVSNLFATLTVAFSLALIAGFFLLVNNIERVIGDLGSSLSVTAYIDDEHARSDVDALITKLKELPGVKNVSYISKGQAMSEFRQSLGERGNILGRLEGRNPLPASLDIQLERQSQLEHSALVEKLEEAQFVGEVVSGTDVVDKISALLDAVKIIGMGGGFFLLGVVVFLILNTIKLVIYSQREEIEIMQLVGATEATVRGPFLVAGAIQGMFGAIVGIILLRLVFGMLLVSLQTSKLFGTTLPLPEFFSLSGVMFILLMGTLLGVIASALAVGRHLRV